MNYETGSILHSSLVPCDHMKDILPGSFPADFLCREQQPSTGKVTGQFKKQITQYLQIWPI